jgi:hypothetical protein
MIKYFFIVLTFTIVGCSSFAGSRASDGIVFNKPRINLYLYTQYENESEKYITALRAEGFEVILRHA